MRLTKEKRHEQAKQWAEDWHKSTGEGPGKQGYIHAYLCGYFDHSMTRSDLLEVSIIIQFEELEAALAPFRELGSKTELLKENVYALLKENCTGSDDHDAENCRKCAEMFDGLMIVCAAEFARAENEVHQFYQTGRVYTEWREKIDKAAAEIWSKRVVEAERETFDKFSDIALSVHGIPSGRYSPAGLLAAVSKEAERRGREFAFTLCAEAMDEAVPSESAVHHANRFRLWAKSATDPQGKPATGGGE